MPPSTAAAQPRIMQKLLVLLMAVLACAASWTSSVQGSDVLPHIDDCHFCDKCIVDQALASSPAAVAARLRGLQGLQLPDSMASAPGTRSTGSLWPSGTGSLVGWARSILLHGPRRTVLEQDPVNPLEDPAQPEWLRASAYRINNTDKAPKHSLPNCTTCRGCNTELQPMVEESRFLDRVYTNEKGGTAGWLFRATTNRTDDGMAVVKVYCMPLPKRPGARVPLCAPATILKNMRLLLAIQKLSDECGFTDIIPRIWVDRVNAPVPGIGYHVRWHALWMEVAGGVSMENVLGKGRPAPLPASTLLDIMHNKLNKTQVVRAAIFDLLTSQCDRHAQNIFMDEHGQINLIDNEAALQSNWKNCAVNSILVPATQKQEIVRLSNEFVNKLITPAQVKRGKADPQLLFDYRCYLPDGREDMGTDYPPQVKQCLTAIASKSVAEVQQHYGFLEELPAYNLRARAKDMLEKGFEYAAMYGEPLNPDSKRYRIQPKCCRVQHVDGRYTCAHAWDPKYEVPTGDPVTGREWKKARPDIGTYKGGDFL